MITHTELLERLHYNEDTGVFTWINPAFNKTQYIGKIAGNPDKEGYLYIKINSRNYRCNRLAWFYIYGIWPKGVIDHINHIVTDNRIENLRDVSFSGNSQNQNKAHADSSHGYFGVRYNPIKKRWQARIQTNGKRISLGGFDTPQEAHEAYVNAKREFHDTCII